MTQLEPALDAYGKYARIPMLADYLEVSALAGGVPRLARLAAYVEERGWLTDSLRRHFGPNTGPQLRRRDTQRDLVVCLQETLEERRTALGEGYPFELSGGTLRAALVPDDSSYLSWLAISTAHAYECNIPGVNVTGAFEALVAESLADRFENCLNFAAVRGAHPNFPDALEDAAAQLGLGTGIATVSTSAQDEKVDTAIHLRWRDARPGRWVLLGQATCAKSVRWQRKLSEIPVNRWKSLFGLQCTPLPFLAVPHHVDRLHLASLVEADGRAVLDRLRLACSGARTPDAVAIVAAVQSLEPVHL